MGCVCMCICMYATRRVAFFSDDFALSSTREMRRCLARELSNERIDTLGGIVAAERRRCEFPLKLHRAAEWYGVAVFLFSRWIYNFFFL